MVDMRRDKPVLANMDFAHAFKVKGCMRPAAYPSAHPPSEIGAWPLGRVGSRYVGDVEARVVAGCEHVGEYRLEGVTPGDIIERILEPDLRRQGGEQILHGVRCQRGKGGGVT